MKNYVLFIFLKKLFFQKVLSFKFLLIFFIDVITTVIPSTQIACDVTCVQHINQ